MRKRFLVSLLNLIIITTVSLWAGTWYEQFSRSLNYDLNTKGEDRVSVTWVSGNDNDNHLVGVLGSTDVGSSSNRYVVVEVSPSNPSSFNFITAQDVTAKRAYVVQVFARGNTSASSGNGDVSIPSSLISFSYDGTGNYGSDIFSGTTVCYVSQSGTLTIIIDTKYDNRNYYKRVHVDIVLTLPKINNIDDLCDADDYISTFKVSIGSGKKQSTVEFNDFYYSIYGYYNKSSSQVEETFLSVTPGEKAASYQLDDVSLTSSYATVGSLEFFSSSNNGGVKTSLDTLPYAIVVSPNNDYLNSSGDIFHFTNPSELFQTIPYTVKIVSDDSMNSTHTWTDLCKNKDVCLHTDVDLTGAESVANISSTSLNRRFILAPQEYMGLNGGNKYYRYYYKGNIQIKLPQSEITAIGNNQYPAGLYTTTIYLFLITR